MIQMTGTEHGFVLYQIHDSTLQAPGSSGQNMVITVGVIGATGTTGGMVVEGLLSSPTDFVSQ